MSAKRGRRWRGVFGFLGGLMFVAGIAGMIRVFVFHRGDTRFLEGSETFATFGLILLVGSVLAKYRITVEEAYRLGEDIGQEKGYQRGRRVARPVVVDLHGADLQGDEVVVNEGTQEEIRLRVHPDQK